MVHPHVIAFRLYIYKKLAVFITKLCALVNRDIEKVKEHLLVMCTVPVALSNHSFNTLLKKLRLAKMCHLERIGFSVVLTVVCDL